MTLGLYWPDVVRQRRADMSVPQNRLNDFIGRAQRVQRGRQPTAEAVPALPRQPDRFQRGANLAPDKISQDQRLARVAVEYVVVAAVPRLVFVQRALQNRQDEIGRAHV